MPSEFIHLAIAGRVAEALSLIAAERPLFMLGSVGADVNNLLGLPRLATHFRGGRRAEPSGAWTFLTTHPHLEAHALSTEERAFVAGYMCHLVTDEQEAHRIAGPYFGSASPYAHDRQAAKELRTALLVLLESDPRVVTAELHQAISDLRAATQISEDGDTQRANAVREDLLPFVSMSDIRQWAQLVLSVADRPPGVERLLHFRSLPPARLRRDGLPGDFAQRFPTLVAELRRSIPEPIIRTFLKEAIRQSAAAIALYLSGGLPPTSVDASTPTGQ